MHIDHDLRALFCEEYDQLLKLNILPWIKIVTFMQILYGKKEKQIFFTFRSPSGARDDHDF